MDLQGKTALITGGGVRLGRAFALGLAKEGVNLALHFNNSRESAQQTAEEAHAFGVEVITIGADFNDPDAVGQVFPKALATFNCIDVLINNAGIYLAGTGLETERETWEKEFRINLQTPFMLIQAFARQLPANRQGRIVNITDAQVLHNDTDHFAYTLTKTALVKMTRMFARELAPRITVNALGPGIMLPLATAADPDLEAYAENYIPLNRIGSPEIATENVLHLLRSDFTSGAFLRVDGGQYL
jgi:glucose 1-dehydrogenase